MIKFCFLFLIFVNPFISSQIWRNHPHTDSLNLYDIAFVDSLHGFAVGDSGLILQTSNGGDVWNAVFPRGRISGVFLRAKIIDSSAIAVLGNFYDGTTFIIQSKDTGMTWNTTEFPFRDVYLTDIYFLNHDTVFVCGLGGAFLRSYNAMRDWEAIDDPSNHFPNRKIYFKDAAHGWIVGGRIDMIGFIKATTDGGATWQNLLIANEPLNDLVFINSDTAIVVGGDPEFGGWIYRSTDSGMNWDLQDIPFSLSTLGSVYSADQKHIWVTGAGSVTLSSNAGRSWSLAKSDSQFIYQSVQSSQKVVWFAGSNGSLQSYQDTTTITAVERSNMEIDKSKFALDVFPNPSNGTAVITFQLGRKQLVKIELYDILGRQIKILLDEELNPGRHTLPLRLDESASAIYLIYCSTNERVTTKQFLFIK